MTARFVQVKFELQYLVFDVIGRGTWRVEVDEMTEHQQPRKLVEPVRYPLEGIKSGEVERLGETNSGIAVVRLEPCLLPRPLRRIVDASLHTSLKVRVSPDRPAGCFTHRPQTATEEVEDA